MSIGISVALGAEVERLRRALRVIEAWARYDRDEGRSVAVALTPEDVIAVCRKALEGSK